MVIMICNYSIGSVFERGLQALGSRVVALLLSSRGNGWRREGEVRGTKKENYKGAT